MPPPTLYWISGSPPAWRVMLALVTKGVPFESHRLDHGANENHAPRYLKLTPKGQVPTLTFEGVVIRESIAILAWLDRAFPDRPIWGENAAAAAMVWQDVMLMEADLRPLVTTAAQGLLRSNEMARDAIIALEHATDALEARLEDQPFLGRETPMAADLWLYPALRWIARGAQLNPHPPKPLQ